MFIPTKNYFLPSFLGKTSSKHGFDAYSYGPSLTGVPLTSGQYFKDKWCAYFKNNEIVLNKLSEGQNYALPSFTGFKLNWFNDFSQSRDASRFTNFSLSFNDSGLPLIGYQDNGDSLVGFQNKPYINLYQLSGARVIQTGWEGGSLFVFNELQIGGGYVSASGLPLRYQTGRMLYFYKKGDSLKYRVQQGFSVSSEFNVLTGVGDFDSFGAIGYFEEDFQYPFDPYKFALVGANNDKTKIKILTSKSYVNYAFETFDKYSSGVLENGFELSGGYGNWKRNFSLGPTIGQCFFNEVSISDSFSGYQTGDYKNEPNNFLIYGFFENKMSQSYVTGQCFSSDLLFLETFDSYQSGDYPGFDGLTSSSFRFGILKSGYSESSGSLAGYSIQSGYGV